MSTVRPERTGWRDQGLSERHRRWGFDCPALDLDFVMLEYDRGEPTALVEYKHERAEPQYASHPSYRALSKLGARADIPVFAARYKDDFSEFLVVPLNDAAKRSLPERKAMTELEWIGFLHRLRGYDLPSNIAELYAVTV